PRGRRFGAQDISPYSRLSARSSRDGVYLASLFDGRRTQSREDVVNQDLVQREVEGMSTREVFIHANGDLLAAAVAARLITSTADTLAADGRAHLVLTGGRIGTKVLAAVAASPARDTVDWQTVDFWWGDERYEPTGDPERNDTGARGALLNALSVDQARVHAVPGPDGPDGDD